MEAQIGGFVFNLIFGIAGFLIGAFILKAILKVSKIVELLESIDGRLKPAAEKPEPLVSRPDGDLPGAAKYLR
jgi:ABC-type tungstate transport system substrate-binding protein